MGNHFLQRLIGDKVRARALRVRPTYATELAELIARAGLQTRRLRHFEAATRGLRNTEERRIQWDIVGGLITATAEAKP